MENKETTKKAVNREAGKGDAPRNLSKLFRKNYDSINWGHKKSKK